MPPTNTLEGLQAAHQIRREFGTSIGIILLSQYVETRYLDELLQDGAGGVGYLLKDRILQPSELHEAIGGGALGGSAIDPLVTEQLMPSHRGNVPLNSVTTRGREGLPAVAEGRGNQSIAAAVAIREKTVGACIGRVFTKLDLFASSDDHGRVRAVLEYLRSKE